MTAFEQRRELADVLLENETVMRHLKPEEIRSLLDPHQYIGTAVQQVERLCAKLQKLYLA
jgi:adenylosuccinate lyase